MPKTDLRLRRYKQSKIARKLGFRGREVNLDLDPAAVTVAVRSEVAGNGRGGGQRGGRRPEKDAGGAGRTLGRRGRR